MNYTRVLECILDSNVHFYYDLTDFSGNQGCLQGRAKGPSVFGEAAAGRVVGVLIDIGIFAI